MLILPVLNCTCSYSVDSSFVLDFFYCFVCTLFYLIFMHYEYGRECTKPLASSGAPPTTALPRSEGKFEKPASKQSSNIFESITY